MHGLVGLPDFAMNPLQHDPVPEQRRRLLCGAGLAMLAGAAWGARPVAAAKPASTTQEAAARVSQHFPFGAVVPERPLPDWRLLTHTGNIQGLNQLCRGKVTAIQLIYTQCSAICPIQGALFAQAQKLAGAKGLRQVQFLSLSVDPLSDTAQALARWLRAFDPGPDWLAAAPAVKDVQALQALLTQGGEARGDTIDAHPGQVYFIQRNGALVHRSPSLPTATHVVSVMQELARVSS